MLPAHRWTLAAIFLLPLLQGCYPLHAVHGHFDLMSRRQPLAEAIAEAGAATDFQNKLALAAHVRDFASRELALPDNGSYRAYARLDGEFPVWSVWVVPEFDLEPRQSCFPVAGCVPYRGYYTTRQAEEYAAPFRAAGDDVLVSGVTAYSTLGYFDDPLTSAMLRLPDEKLAGLIFHELAHQVVYVQDNATFNESFARAVEIEGTLRWLARENPAALPRHEAGLARAEAFHAGVKAARAQLGAVYALPLSAADKRRRKAAIFQALRHEHAQRKQSDPAWAAYDGWFVGELNNASLAAVATYYDEVEHFRAMLRAAGGDFGAFFRQVRRQAGAGREHASR